MRHGVIAVIVGLAVMAGSASAGASGWGVGTDIIRFIDNNQDRDGLLNVFYEADADDDFGFVGKVGYEHRLARNFAVTGAVRMVAGVDERLVGARESPVYQPMLGMVVVF